MKLIELLKCIPDELEQLSHLANEYLNSEVTGVTSDSREVRPGSIFVAVQGGTQDGHQFVGQAERQGAILAIGQQDLQSLNDAKSLTIPYVRTKSDSRQILAALASKYFGSPSESLLMIGVTGTSGKTTTTYLIESILQAAGHCVGVIGTVNFRYGSRILPSTFTTPGAVELQRLLAMMKSEGCTAVVMEVSSHALKQRRVDSIAFDAMVFTNLSPEHLDFHPDMESYFKAKAILFTHHAEFAAKVGKKPVGIINGDDPFGQRLARELRGSSHASSFGELSEYHISSDGTQSGLQATLNGIQGQIDGISVQSSLTGQFNCSNIGAAVSVTRGLQIPSDKISQGIFQLSEVPGRLERVENSQGIHVWVDYAHKPDALEKVIKTLRAMRGGHRLFTVFGCGGDRDRKKRPVMGQIAVQWSDYVYITSDNPRTEDPEAIIREILKGTDGYQNFSVESDRRKAIHNAILAADPGDLVLIAGKGHEDYQIIGRNKVHFDDREVAQDALRSKKG